MTQSRIEANNFKSKNIKGMLKILFLESKLFFKALLFVRFWYILTLSNDISSFCVHKITTNRNFLSTFLSSINALLLQICDVCRKYKKFWKNILNSCSYKKNTVSKIKKSYPLFARKQEAVLIKKASKRRKKEVNTCISL